METLSGTTVNSSLPLLAQMNSFDYENKLLLDGNKSDTAEPWNESQDCGTDSLRHS